MQTTIYEQYTVSQLIRLFSIPAILSLLVELLTSIVDTAFAGHLPNQADQALAAMGLLTPLFTVFVAIQTLFAVSTAVLISTHLAKRDWQRPLQLGVHATILLGVITSLITFLCMTPIFNQLQLTGEVASLAKDYLLILLFSHVFSSIGYTLTSVIRAFGHPKVEMTIISLAVVINIMSNAYFTFGLNLGIKGIALGTLLSEVVCALLAFIYLKRKKQWYRYTNYTWKERFHTTYALLKIGIAQTIIQALGGMTAWLANKQLQTFGTTQTIGAWNIANKVYIFCLMPIVGITQAIQTILAYFHGQRNLQKKRLVIRTTLQWTTIYSVLLIVIFFLFGQNVLQLLTNDEQLLREGQSILNIIFITLPLTGFAYTVMTQLQVTEQELQAVGIGLTRQIFAMLPLIYLLPILVHTFALPFSQTEAIFLAIPFADFLTAIVAYVFIRKQGLFSFSKQMIYNKEK